MRLNLRACSAFGIVLFALFQLPQSAYADAAPKWTDAQLAAFSDVILRGRVTAVAVGRDDRAGSPYTYVSLDVAEVLKGAIPNGQVTLKQLGGRIGSTALQIAGQPAFTAGEDVLLFLEVRPRDRTLTTTALWQGKFSIDGDVAVRQDPGGPARGVFNGQTRRLAPWLEELRRYISDAPAPSAGAVETAPPERPLTTSDPSGGAATAASWPEGEVRVDIVSPGQPGLANAGEPQLRKAAEFWTSGGAANLAAGGLQPPGCFTSRDPDGRISVGVDSCRELSPRGGTIAVSGGWIAYDVNGGAGPRLIGGGVITNGGEMAVRLLSRPACFERLVTHELGHAIGLADTPDGSGPMSPTLDCDAGFGTNASSDDGIAAASARPTFVPLRAPAVRSAADSDALFDSIACAVGCRIAAATAISAPNAPTNLGASLSGTSLTLTWTAPLTDATHEVPTAYTVEGGSTSGGTDVLNASTGSTATTYTTTVAANSTRYFRVRATNSFGASDPSNEVVVLVGTVAVPDAPTNLAYTLTGSALALTWTAPASGGVTGYIVQAGSSSGATDYANVATGSTATTFSATVGGNAVFYIRVRATNTAGTSLASNELVVVVGSPSQPPGAPTALTASISGSSVTLSWTAPATGGAPTSYIVEAGSTTGSADLASFSTSGSSTTFSAAGVAAGTYFVRVKAQNGAGTSLASSEIVVIVGTACTAAQAPSNLVASASGSTVTLQWTAGANATSYGLQAGSGPGLSDLFDRDLVSAATSLTAVNVGAGTYFVRVRSINTCSVSAASNEAIVIIR